MECEMIKPVTKAACNVRKSHMAQASIMLLKRSMLRTRLFTMQHSVVL